MTCHRFETPRRIIVPPTEQLPFYSPNDRRGVGGNIDRKLRRYSFEKSIRLSDTQLKEVLAEMATIPALSPGYCLFRPEFRERYVPAVFDGVRISDEIGNRALLDAVHRELLARVMGIPGILGHVADRSFYGTRGFAIYYQGARPKLPSFFDDVPNVVLQESHPLIIRR